MSAQRREDHFKERPIAPESLKTQKVREKLLKAWEAEKEQITTKAIQETVGKIHKWIADNSRHRVPIKEKSIRLFNQNQNAADISKKVQLFAEKIRNNMHPLAPIDSQDDSFRDTYANHNK